MYSCNGVPIYQRDLTRAEQQVISAFNQAKHKAMLPKNAHYNFDNSSIWTTNIEATGKLDVNPISMSCLNQTQTDAVIMHEVWHYQNPHSDWHNLRYTSQDFLLIAAAGVIAIAIGRYAAFRCFGLQKPRLNTCALSVVGVLMLHSINGLSLIQDARNDEKHADHFSEREMHSGLPFAEALERFNKTSFDTPVSQFSSAESYTAERIEFFRQYGAVGLEGRKCLHPDTKQRIKTLRAYKPPDNVHLIRANYRIANSSIKLRGLTR